MYLCHYGAPVQSYLYSLIAFVFFKEYMDPLELQLKPGQRFSKRLTRRGRKGRFLRGPIPWDWLCAVARLPGKALHVGLVLWHVVGLKKSREVKLERRHLHSFGLGRKAVYAGLKAMEEQGLVGLSKKTGGRPTITILKGDEDDG